MYICVTHVDSKTKVAGYKKPMRNGPAFPDVKGLNIVWWDESRWPLTHPDDYPKFYGTCDEDADISLDGVIKVLTELEYNTAKEAEDYARLPSVASPSQFRLALKKLNMLDDLLTSIENMEEPLKSAVKIDWEFATEINKHSQLIDVFKTNVGWDENTITQLFITASDITVDSFTNIE